jgi:uncharacterized membrane protein
MGCAREGGDSSDHYVRIYPVMVWFPVAFLAATPFLDLIYWQTADPAWGRASLWLVGAGATTGILAATAGFLDYAAMGRHRRSSLGIGYAWANTAALILVLLNLWLRYWDPAASVLPAGLALSGAAVALLVLTAWFSDQLARRKRWLHGSKRGRKRARYPRGNHNHLSTYRSR